MNRPKRSEDKYWKGTRNFDDLQYELNLEEYISEIEEQMQAKNISSKPMLADSCHFYEQDNTTAMNCKHCGKSKWIHGNGNFR